MDCAPEWAPGRESSLRSAGWASKGSGEALHLAVGRHVRARKLPLELVWIKNHPDDGSTSVYCSTDEKCRLAVGNIVDGQAIAGNTVFGEEQEFHVKVEWKNTVADDKGVMNREVRQKYDYSLPVRNVFCGMSRHDVADWIADELQRRGG